MKQYLIQLSLIFIRHTFNNSFTVNNNISITITITLGSRITSIYNNTVKPVYNSLGYNELPVITNSRL
jgi:hypothetical protein